MPGVFEGLLERVAGGEEFDFDSSGTAGGGGGGTGKPDDVAGLIELGAIACLRWLWILS